MITFVYDNFRVKKSQAWKRGKGERPSWPGETGHIAAQDKAEGCVVSCSSGFCYRQWQAASPVVNVLEDVLESAIVSF